ncbi:MAG: hypothetical protein K2K12_06395, partial [Clostridia bacterium]|nr:hypothetical protein [Clostridia bacterium]
TPQNVTKYVDGTQKKDIVYDYNVSDWTADTWKLLDAEWYNFSDFVTASAFTYKTPDGKAGTTPSAVHNAGTYEVTFTVTNDSPYKFAGGATEKKCTITVKQKEIDYTLKLYSGNTAQSGSTVTYGSTSGYSVKADYKTGDISDTGTLAPDIEIKYKGNSPTVYAESTTFPTEKGSYTATLTDKNAGTSNYVLKSTTNSNAFTFTIGAASVTLPTIAPATTSYNAADQDFTLTNFDASVLKISSITADDTTLTQSGDTWSDGAYSVKVDTSSTIHKITAKTAAKYVVTFELQTSATNYAWDSSLNGKDKTATFTISKAKLSGLTLVPPADANNSWSWADGTKGTVTASTITGVQGTDGVTYNVSYYKGTESPAAAQTGVKLDDIAFDIENLKGGMGIY